MCRSIWPTGGFASSVSRTGYPIIRCSAVRGMSAFVRATPCAGCSRVWWRDALRLGLLVARRSRLMRAFKADVDKKKRLSGDQPIARPKSEEASHAVREYLAALDAARSEDESDRSGDGSGSKVGAPRWHLQPGRLRLRPGT